MLSFGEGNQRDFPTVTFCLFKCKREKTLPHCQTQLGLDLQIRETPSSCQALWDAAGFQAGLFQTGSTPVIISLSLVLSNIQVWWAAAIQRLRIQISQRYLDYHAEEKSIHARLGRTGDGARMPQQPAQKKQSWNGITSETSGYLNAQSLFTIVGKTFLFSRCVVCTVSGAHTITLYI